MKRQSLIFFVLACTVLLWPLPAMAESMVKHNTCICALPSLDTRIKRSDKIFTGTITQIDIADDMKESGRIDPPAIVTFSVTERFKNDNRKKVQPAVETLHTNLTRATCTGHPFIEGESYVVYAVRRRMASPQASSLYPFATDTYDTGGLCGGTRLLKEAESEDEIVTLRRMREEGQLMYLRRFWQRRE